MIKLALLSFWHVHADDYFKQATEHPDTEVIAVWDEIPERGRKEAEARGISFYESLDELLANDEINGVLVNTPTDMHRDVIVAAANAGKHIFTEKVLATTTKEANEILEAVERNNVKLTVSLPYLNNSYTVAIQEILEKKLLGDLTLVRIRLSHNGATGDWLPEHFYNLEQCGGGALIDLGCHPMYLTRLFLGLPDTISAQYGYVTGKEVEDNAVATLKYSNGALGIVEAGFVTSHSPFTIEINGTQGTLIYSAVSDTLQLHGNLIEGATEAWLEVSDFPEARASALQQWVKHIQTGSTAEDNLQLALDLTKLMEASNLSVQHNKAVRLDGLG